MSEQASQPGALADLVVVELAEGVAAPYCGKLMADLGADVIKVEPPRRGDRSRHQAPFYHDEPTADGGLLYNYLNTSKRGVTLDLATPSGRGLLDRLAALADVLLIGGGRADLLARGLDPETVRASHADLVCTYVTPFGLSGPNADRRAGELVAFQMSALGLLTPDTKGAGSEQPPLKAGGNQALMIAGLTAAIATMEALFARERSAVGQLIDVSEVEPVASFQFMNVARWLYMGDAGLRGFREGNRRVYCKDGAVSLLIGQDHQWRAFAEVMGSPEWADDPAYQSRPGRSQHWATIVARIQAWAADYTKEEIYRMAQAKRVPLFPENTIAEAVDSAQVQSRDFIREVPLANGARVRAPTAPYAFSETPARVSRPAPRLGEHNRDVFGGQLGLSAAELASAYEAGVV
jgi:crotonobetainyl-CoA:carnitine CoA-transferase CaiB-like acyl-CoA transferase